MTEQLSGLLIVDDEPHIRSSIRRALFDEYQVTEAESGEKALSLLRSGLDVKIIISDMFMPGGINGIELFGETKRLAPQAKRILMTGRSDAEIAMKAVNMGSINYFIQKPWDLHELTAVLHQMNQLSDLEKKNEILLLELKYANQSLIATNEELKRHRELLRQSLDERTNQLMEALRDLEEANAELKKAAIRDGLTGLYNHVTIKSRLEEEIARSQRYSSEVSILFCDVDHFKLYNDRLGHDVGDIVLKSVSKFLIDGNSDISPSRKSDIIGRYGGEEFVLILPQTSKEGALIRAERLRQGINLLDVPGAKQQPLGHLSVSIGVATYPQDASSMEEILKKADEALYRAKGGGRDRVVPAVSANPQ
ncbi:diguanylate cyclase [Myxococcota bacterium]|nr:diguanylate cyclase [Myxococcota bacterium]MBU1380041.1 diguanylate cyclase [Myxococcota bacterium]MBU1495499.1 diguanylate cyclase [Myxococcota bacterium]